MAFWTKEEEKTKSSEDISISGKEDGESHKSEALTVREPEKEPLSREELIASRYGKLRSALGAGTVIQGKLSFDTAVRIDGKLSGEVFSTSALIVGKSGSIDANIEVDSLIVLGSVKGSVKAKERVELLAGGSLEGDLTAPVLVVEEGARLSGDCRMNSAPKIPAPQPKKEIEQEAKALKDKKAKASSSADKAGEKAQEVRVH